MRAKAGVPAFCFVLCFFGWKEKKGKWEKGWASFFS
jgi:hypothetical protein